MIAERNLIGGVSTAELGLFFRQRRLESSVSEVEVVEYLGDITVENLREYENGEKTIPLSAVYGISNRLNIPTDIVINYLDIQ